MSTLTQALAAILIISGLAAWRLTGAIRRFRARYIQRMTDAQANEEWLREHVFHPGMSVPDLDMPHGMWPTCGTPPCDWEEGWTCIRHQPRGKHHAVWQAPLDDQPAEVILAVVTDCEKRRQP